MKILFLCRLYAPHIGGVEKHVTEIAKRLLAEGNEVYIITEKYDEKLQDFEIINGVTVYRFATGSEDRFKKIRIWHELFKRNKVIFEADIIHCHDVFFWYLPFRFIYATKPVYTTFHGYESYPIRKKAVLIRKLSERLSWGNICIGDFICKWYGTKPDYVSYGAVTIPKSKNKQIKPPKDSAVFIGRLDEQTGILTYAKAIETIRKKYPGFTMMVVGDGKYRKTVEKNFKTLGFQKDPEKYFSDYHFAFVSRYLSILEAFAAKKLVFAVYDNPVKEDYLSMAPFAKWIVIEKDPQKLSEKIDFFIKHPDKEEDLINNAFTWVKEYTWQKLVTVYLTLWEKN